MVRALFVFVARAGAVPELLPHHHDGVLMDSGDIKDQAAGLAATRR